MSSFTNVRLAAALLALGSPGFPVPCIGGGARSRHNVTRCCQCGATIGRGRDGRRCKTCREATVVDDLSDVALPYGFGGKPVVEVRIPGKASNDT